VKNKIQKINKTDYVVCAYAQHATGPGWLNTPLWYIVKDENRKLREECLQPEEQSMELKKLYKIAEEVHKALVCEIEKIVK